ncbi:uncharacterized protein LOC128990247 [Macrosteles quadrilineatus]|uniref:uncharacterized protein LOC128990247 n=1 Tax=Macrosteles quadrilineatus TaxID=74068 RepID=UPI0023E34A26|nr:uncharacterized protein LOC128990247 [Macrosteles quadrilineatus]
MSQNILREYAEEVDKLRQLGKDLDLSEEQINQIIEDSFHFLETEGSYDQVDRPVCPPSNHSPKRIWIVSCVICLLLVFSAGMLQKSSLFGYRKAINNYVERNVQEMIYPGMKLFRKLMLPVVNQFPSLTAWYDETCLIGNPYFQVSDMECWPCEGVRSVLNLTGSPLNHDSCHSGLPFVYKEEAVNEINYETLRQTYLENKDMFDRDALRVVSPGELETIADVLEDEHFQSTELSDLHIAWRLNRLEPTRAIRKLFGSPQNIPPYTTGSTPEKFVLLDEPKASPYPLPTTEGSTVFVVQASGARMIVLTPAPECKHHCHRVSIVLQPRHILWYNWWYWRASSFPLVINSKLSITYVGSFF